MKLFTKSRASAALKFPFQLIEKELVEVEASIIAEAKAAFGEKYSYGELKMVAGLSRADNA